VILSNASGRRIPHANGPGDHDPVGSAGLTLRGDRGVVANPGTKMAAPSHQLDEPVRGSTVAAAGQVHLVPGFVLDDRYVIESELGRGGMGCVFAARDTKLQREVAIKVVNAATHDDADLRRLVQEARSAGSLAHPNIVAVHDVGTFGGGPYLVQERLHGSTLRDLLRQGAMAPDRALDVAVQIARGLAAAHDHGVVHRDLKPDNLFVAEDGWVKILDFGVATLQANADSGTVASTNNGSFAGTPGYMSPEQVQGHPVDARSDLFSFGAIFYEMLSGGRAFERATPIETAWAIVHDRAVALPPTVPPRLERVVQRCLQKDPRSRFQSARDLVFHLEAFRAGPEAVAPRRPIALVVSIAALLVAIAVAGTFWLRRDRLYTDFRQLTFDRGSVWSARFAPDGHTVFYAAVKDTSPLQLQSVAIGRPESRRLDVPPGNLLAVSSTGELAVLLRPRLGGFGFNRGTLARVLPTGAAPRELLEDVDYADWAPDGSGLAVVRTVGARKRLEYPLDHVLFETTGWIGDPRFSPDGRRIAFVHHPSPHDDAGSVMVTELDGRVRPWTHPWRSVQGLAWARGASEIWFTAAGAGTTTRNVVLRAVDSDGAERVLAQIGGDLRLQDVAPDNRALLTEPEHRLGLEVASTADGKLRDLSRFDRTFLGDLSDDGGTVLFSVAGPAAGATPVVYVRNTDGSAPVQLGSGLGLALSPDSRRAVALPADVTALRPLTILPTGPGQPTTLAIDGVEVARARWFADGERLLLAGVERGHGMRLYIRSIEGGSSKPISQEGVSGDWLAVSRDGSVAAALDARGRTTLFPVDGGEPVPVPELQPGEVPFGFANDGSLFVGRLPAGAVDVFRFDLRTRRRTLLARLSADAPGALTLVRVQVTPDGRTSAFTYASESTNLYLLQGSR
jgi:eukaryotic-like serine/threonine-protein kinase